MQWTSSSSSFVVILVAVLAGCTDPDWYGSETGPSPAEEAELISLWQREMSEKRILMPDDVDRLKTLAYSVLPDLRSIAGFEKHRWFIFQQTGDPGTAGRLFVALWLISEFDSPTGTKIIGPPMTFSMTYAPGASHEGFIRWNPGDRVPRMFGSRVVAGDVKVVGPGELRGGITIENAELLLSQVRFDILSRVGLSHRQSR